MEIQTGNQKQCESKGLENHILPITTKQIKEIKTGKIKR